MKQTKTLGFMLSLALFGAVSAVDAAELIRKQFLLSEPAANASQIKVLPAKTQVEILERRGGWRRVSVDGSEGWLRVLALRENPKAVSTGQALLSLVQQDAQTHQRVTSVAGLRSVPSPRPSSHALILTIGEYQNNIPRLKGVVHDADTAALMARALGVPDENVTAMSDAQLTLAGMRNALDGLHARVMPNDEVFIYYSGHGTRLNAFDGREKRCAEALLTVDGNALLDSELEKRLQDIAIKARRVVVFLDACHAGGLTTRAVETTDDERLSAKFWAKSNSETGAPESCERPVNALTRALIVSEADVEAKNATGKLNFVHIAAARENEAALDDGQRGGLASQAWLECLNGAALDQDGSAGLSIRELQMCAQPQINRLAQGNSRFLPHHITVTGNSDMVLAAPNELPEVVDALAVLKDMYANRDDRRMVRLTADRPAYKVKRDRVRFTLQSSHYGYVYLLMVGSDGKQFDLLFPNKKDGRNIIQADEIWTLPRPHWAIRAGGPAGTNHLLALVSDTPRDFAGLGMRPVGPFSVLGASPSGARDIQLVTAGVSQDEPTACSMSGEQRTLDIADSCSVAYGADLINLIEID
jgi:hypothetical protein